MPKNDNNTTNSLLQSINLVRAMLWNEINTENKRQENLRKRLRKQLGNDIKHAHRSFQDKFILITEKITQLPPNQGSQKEKLEAEKSLLQRKYVEHIADLTAQSGKLQKNQASKKTKNLYSFLTNLEKCADNIKSNLDAHSLQTLKEICQDFGNKFPQSRSSSSVLAFFQPTSPLQAIYRKLGETAAMADGLLKLNISTSLKA